jgi:hypothetical protein
MSNQDQYWLSKGSHPTGDAGRCAMEWVAFLAGEPHSDQPVCVSDVLKRFCIDFNDALDDESRQKLRPYLARTIGTAGDGQDGRRAFMCLDWIVRTYTPAWLSLAGLDDDARALRQLPEIVDIDAAWHAAPFHQRRAPARESLSTLRGTPRGTLRGAAARDARGPLRGTLRGTLRGGAAGTLRGPTRAGRCVGRCVGAAAWAAAGAAAGAAADRRLKPTVQQLQASAFDLLERMLPKVAVELPAVERRDEARELTRTAGMTA